MYLKILLILLLPTFAVAQYSTSYWEEFTKNQTDSLRSAFQKTTNDTLRMEIARGIAYYYIEVNRDSALYFFDYQLRISRQLNLKLWEADALDNFGYLWAELKNYPKALQAFIEALKISENEETEKDIWHFAHFTNSGLSKNARLIVLGFTHNDLAGLYAATGNTRKAILNNLEAAEIARSFHEQTLLSTTHLNLGNIYLNLEKLDSAMDFTQKSLNYSLSCGFKKYRAHTLTLMGKIYLKKGNNEFAKQYFNLAYLEAKEQNNFSALAQASIALADLFAFTNNKDSSLWYAKNGLKIYQSLGSPSGLLTAYISLSAVYKLQANLDSAFIYQGLAMSVKDSLNSVEKINQFTNIGFDERLRLQEVQQEKIQLQNKIKTYAMLVGILVFMIIALLLYRNNRNSQKAHAVLQHQKETIEHQKKKVELTLSELKSTQSQLIQSEKMASLGELTAGIAHEIQNPLNFVNNFSDLSSELMDEMTEELASGNLELATEIAGDIKQNLEKINHHGKRADSIVKGMLQHSRSSSGVKEPTDINSLADEYLRLSYHGLRAKDKTFNAEIKTDFDKSIGKINIVPQDIGRVLLNLINNAFYAVAEKKKTAIENYEPIVSVTTRNSNNKVEIIVADNGNGIPQKVLDKIFQPFFTTKPTGEGTGLGLSLSYDIIKAHGGEIKAANTDTTGARFTISLPYKSD
jgi:two-component system NtrC family sensor kinase